MDLNSVWVFKIKNASGTLLANITQAYNKRVGTGLNMAGEASFSCNVQDLHTLAESIGQTVDSLLGIGINTLECYRNDVRKFTGLIVSGDYYVDQNIVTVNVKALGWFWLLGERYIGIASDRVFTNTDAGTIAWTIIDESQSLSNGDIGITQGSIDTSTNRTLTYTRKNIKDAIIELSDSDNGFDFEFTDEKVFNVYYPQKGSDKTSTVRYYYPSDVIVGINERKDATDVHNYIYGLGYGLGDNQIVYEGEDSTSQSVYKRREALLSFRDVSNTTVLQDLVTKSINKYRGLTSTYRITIVGNNDDNVGNYDVGDYIYISVDLDHYSFERSLRVFEIQYDIDEDDFEQITLVTGII